MCSARPLSTLPVLLLFLLAPAVATASSPWTYGYFGIDLAGTKITQGADDFMEGFDDESADIRFHGGYRANRWVGIEGGFHGLGRYREGSYRAGYSAFIITGMLYLPVTRSADLYGRAGGGVAYLSENDRNFSSSSQKAVGMAGLGMQFHINPELALRAGVDLYALEPQIRGPEGAGSERSRQRIGAGYLGLSVLF